MGNRNSFEKIVRGKKAEAAEYIYNDANQLISAREYDGKHWKTVAYTNDADGNRIMREEIKPDGTRKVENVYEYTVENRLKAVSDKGDLLTAMAYDGDGNRIFQLNYNLHTDDDWKGNSGNGNGNNKDNAGSGNSGNTSGNGTGSKAATGEAPTAAAAEETEPGFWDRMVSFFTGDKEAETEVPAAASNDDFARKNDKPNGNNGNGNGNKPNKSNDNTSTGGTNDNNGNANGNTNNTGGSQNQSGILFPIDGEVSELESELIGMIKTTGKEKNYELVEYVNDVNRDYAEVLMELNINGIMDTAYSYGDQRLTNERFTGWTGYYTYDPRGSVTGVTDEKGMIWQSYRYDVFGEMSFGKPQYNNVYSYNAESYNPNMDTQYLRARYYSVGTANFLTEDSYLGKGTDPLSLNRYNYVKSSPQNYIDPSGCSPVWFLRWISAEYTAGKISTEDMAILLIAMNITNINTGLHEIAQVLSAKALSLFNFNFVTLEQKVEIAGTKNFFGKCKTKEIDILADTTIWEVKPVTYRSPSKKSELNNAKNQIDEYAANSPGYHKGTSLEFPGVYGVHLFEDVYMSVDTAGFYSGMLGADPTLAGLLFYSLSRPNSEGKLEPVSIPALVKDLERNRNEAALVFGTVAGITFAEDIITAGAGVLNDIPSLLAGAGSAVSILLRGLSPAF